MSYLILAFLLSSIIFLSRCHPYNVHIIFTKWWGANDAPQNPQATLPPYFLPRPFPLTFFWSISFWFWFFGHNWLEGVCVCVFEREIEKESEIKKKSPFCSVSVLHALKSTITPEATMELNATESKFEGEKLLLVLRWGNILFTTSSRTIFWEGFVAKSFFKFKQLNSFVKGTTISF